MATVKKSVQVPTPPPTFTVELTADEALYLHHALLEVNPTEASPFSVDPIFDDLDAALKSADVNTNGTPWAITHAQRRNA